MLKNHLFEGKKIGHNRFGFILWKGRVPYIVVYAIDWTGTWDEETGQPNLDSLHYYRSWKDYTNLLEFSDKYGEWIDELPWLEEEELPDDFFTKHLHHFKVSRLMEMAEV